MNEDNKIFKTNEFSIEVSPVENTKQVKNVQYFSYDENSGLQLIHILMDGKPLDLPNGTEIRLSAVKLNNQNQKLIYTPEIVDPLNGIVSFVIPREFLGYQGRIRCGLYINFSNNQTMHVGYFYINMGVSDIDTNLTEFTEDFWQGWSEFEAGSTAKMQELEQRIDEQTEIFNNADVYNKAEIEDKLEPFALRTDIDTLEIKKADKTALAQANASMATNLATKVDKGGNEQITMPMLSQDVKTAMTGGSVAVVGPSGVNTTNVANGAITSPKLSNSFNYRTFLAGGALLDVLDVNGFYLYSATSISDSPFATGAGILENIKTDDYIIQNVTEFATGIKYFRTVRQSISRVTEWVSSEIKNSSISRSKLSSDFDSKGNFQDVDLNSLIDSGTYLLTGTTANIPVGFSGSLLLTVQKNGLWIHQTLSLLQNPSQKAYRYYFVTGNLWGEWEIASNKPLSGKVVVNFGDSLFGNTQGASSVSNAIANVTGAVVYNCGFGGCRMAGGQEIEAWQAFSMFRLSDEIVKENDDPTKWNLQDAAVNNEIWNNKPTYFDNTLSVLKGIDFSTVDFITIAYGTNDYTGGNSIDDESNPLNTDTFSGALRYSLEKIMAKYKQLKILICTPTYRLWFNPDGSVESDSDTRDYASSGTLIDYVEAEKEIAKEFKIPFLDNYFGLGINKYNALEFFTVQDGTHHNEIGRKLMGEKIGSALITQF
ncbi:BppU family phage baseplate upper protein [Enterococcus faecium]|uniref:BppU family phage baseplate upper protein n=1 Tax=Enterococcus faecium TaxID=1352 RepID=UPI001141C0E0|nr:BppU family phage baseplate upper protein [Enterococcus faecium]NTR93128.1 BppU family phage baseplate upper protein [Enterococcus faecium]TQB27004.1 DUF2479 domain-containing protein [Enterococcus faecium]